MQTAGSSLLRTVFTFSLQRPCSSCFLFSSLPDSGFQVGIWPPPLLSPRWGWQTLPRSRQLVSSSHFPLPAPIDLQGPEITRKIPNALGPSRIRAKSPITLVHLAPHPSAQYCTTPQSQERYISCACSLGRREMGLQLLTGFSPKCSCISKWHKSFFFCLQLEGFVLPRASNGNPPVVQTLCCTPHRTCEKALPGSLPCSKKKRHASCHVPAPTKQFGCFLALFLRLVSAGAEPPLDHAQVPKSQLGKCMVLLKRKIGCFV